LWDIKANISYLKLQNIRMKTFVTVIIPSSRPLEACDTIRSLTKQAIPREAFEIVGFLAK
jgi:hypothetical protein